MWSIRRNSLYHALRPFFSNAILWLPNKTCLELSRFQAGITIYRKFSCLPDPLAVNGQTQRILLAHQPLQIVFQRADAPRIRWLGLSKLLQPALGLLDLPAHNVFTRDQRFAIHRLLNSDHFSTKSSSKVRGVRGRKSR